MIGRTVAALAGFGFVIAIALAIVVVHPRSGPSAAAPADGTTVTATTSADTSVDTTVSSSWNVKVTREEAIAHVRGLSDYVDPASTESAKLMSLGDLKHSAESVPQPAGETPSSAQIWAVEVIGKFTAPFGGDTTSWGIWMINADDGSTVGVLSGPGPSPAYWDNLPDHATS